MHGKNRAGPQWNVKMNHTSVYHKKNLSLREKRKYFKRQAVCPTDMIK